VISALPNLLTCHHVPGCLCLPPAAPPPRPAPPGAERALSWSLAAYSTPHTPHTHRGTTGLLAASTNTNTNTRGARRTRLLAPGRQPLAAGTKRGYEAEQQAATAPAGVTGNG
jgi:hypothetical protein